MANEGIPVTKELITWARERAGLTLDEAAKKLKLARLADWEAGTSHPTYPQLEKLADAFKIPVAVFFFPDPPSLPPIRESFRTLPDTEYERLPRQVRLLLRKAKALQLNLAELTGGRNPAQRLIARDLRFPDDVSPDAMAARVREYLGVTLETQFAWPDDDTALKAWRKALQDVGVFVFKDAFRVDEFFGFSLYDDTFPLIYVNNSSTKTRQIFTLFHELGHILFQTSGIDVQDEQYVPRLAEHQRRIEVLCNRFAAQFLVPEAAFTAEIAGRDRTEQTAEYLAARFRVSREVLYRKFLDRRWITQGDYRMAVDRWNGQRQPRKSKGGDPYYTKIAYLGREYMELAFRNYYQNRIDDAQLAEYLIIKPKHLGTLEEYFTAGSQ